MTVVLFFADIFGRPGRKAIAASIAQLKQEFSPDFIFGNAENLAGGRGMNRKSLQELFDLGFHGFTGGNHTWDNKEIYGLLESDPRILRPANFPSPYDSPCPGRGAGFFQANGKSIYLINLLGRVFMDSVDCPFAAIDEILREYEGNAPVLVDMHCDATSEKYAMGWYLDGRVSAVVGSHSHVQTADERLLPKGTAYITDVGMTGSFDSVIGMRPQEVIARFTTKRPHHYQPATENLGICCVVIRIGDDHKAISIERIRRPVELRLDSDKDTE